MIWGVPSAQFLEVRVKVRGYLENIAGRSKGHWTADYLERAIMNADKQLWVADDFDAIALTSVAPNSVKIEAVTGRDRSAWAAEGLQKIEAWARSMNKGYVIALTRPGWTRDMKYNGYREAHREFVKEV